jgi:uncharacterized short protein YbdD (DUF466 family)
MTGSGVSRPRVWRLAGWRPAGWRRPRQWARALHWYLRELTGESDYDRYLSRHACVHPGGKAMTRREFDTWRWTEKANTPGNRCC